VLSSRGWSRAGAQPGAPKLPHSPVVQLHR
jgi:hypothetical protein